MTQVDVIDGRSGLVGLERKLQGVESLEFVHLDGSDVVRHRIVADIVAAYEKDAANDVPRRTTRSSRGGQTS
jgi:phosphate starvation-inducible PhoH-like protein